MSDFESLFLFCMHYQHFEYGNWKLCVSQINLRQRKYDTSNINAEIRPKTTVSMFVNITSETKNPSEQWLVAAKLSIMCQIRWKVLKRKNIGNKKIKASQFYNFRLWIKLYSLVSLEALIVFVNNSTFS